MAIDPRRIRRGPAEIKNHRRKVLTVAALALAAQSFPEGAHAQLAASGTGGAPRDPWRITSSIGIDETYSDNINLSSAGNERSDFVTSINPRITVTRLGRYVTADLTYSPQYIYYARGTNGNALRNSLSADARATLIDNFLTFDAAASIQQQNISPFGTQAANTFNGSTNRAETRTYSFGPTVRSRYDQDLTYSAGYRYFQSGSNSSAYSSSHTSSVFGDFQSSTSFRNIGFGGNFNRTEQDYSGSNSIVTETVGSNLTYVVSPTVHLRGNVGYDRNRYPTTGQPDLQGVSYSGGFDWQPSHHSSLNAQIGHRYFGPTANISAQQTTAKYALNASYTRDQTTSTGSGLQLVQDPNYALLDQFYRATITDPVLRGQAVATALQQAGLSSSQYGTSSFLSNQLYVQKRVDVSLALFGLRNTVTFDAARTESQSLSAITSGFDVFNTANRFQATIYSANWSHKLGPRTTANATIQKIHNQAITGIGDTRQRIFTASMNRQFSRYLNGSVLYRNTTQTSDSNSSGFFSGNYRENSVLGSLRLTF